MENIKASIRGFLKKHFGSYEIKDDEDIFALGFVNSLFAMQLVMFIEKEFEITIENEDLDLKNFKSINLISELVKRKQEVYV